MYHIYFGNPKNYDEDNDYDFIVIINDDGKEIGAIKPGDLDKDIKVYVFLEEIQLRVILKRLHKAKIYHPYQFNN